MHTNTGRQTRQKLREPLQRAQRLYFFIFVFLFFHHYQRSPFLSKGTKTT